MLLSFAWFAYFIGYNQLNCSTCFLTSIKSIWKLSVPEIVSVWDSFTNNWWSSYYYPSAFHLFFVLIVCCLIFYKHIGSFLRLRMFFMLLVCLTYFLLFYYQFDYHDYYFICFIPFLSLIPISFYQVYRQFRDKIPLFMVFLFLGVFLTITVLSMNYGRRKIIQRCGIAKGKIETVSKYYYTLENYLNQISIPKNALLLSYPYNTCSATLYFMNRRGWTLKKGEYLAKTSNEYYDRGAEYLIVNGVEIPSEMDINLSGTDKVGQHGRIKIYKLVNKE